LIEICITALRYYIVANFAFTGLITTLTLRKTNNIKKIGVAFAVSQALYAISTPAFIDIFKTVCET